MTEIVLTVVLAVFAVVVSWINCIDDADGIRKWPQRFQWRRALGLLALVGGLTFALLWEQKKAGEAQDAKTDELIAATKSINWATTTTVNELTAARDDLIDAKNVLDQQTALMTETKTELAAARDDLGRQARVLRISAEWQVKNHANEALADIGRMRFQKVAGYTEQLYSSLDLALESIYIAAAGQDPSKAPDSLQQSLIQVLEGINFDQLHGDFLRGLEKYDPPAEDRMKLVADAVASIKKGLDDLKKRKMPAMPPFLSALHKVRQDIRHFRSIGNEVTAEVQIAKAEGYRAKWEELSKLEIVPKTQEATGK